MHFFGGGAVLQDSSNRYVHHNTEVARARYPATTSRSSAPSKWGSTRPLEGADTVIECLGNSQRGEALDVLVASVAACASPPALLVLGGSPALCLPSGEPATAAPRIAGMAGLAKMHLATLEKLNRVVSNPSELY
jgi:hypothetical protein